MSERCLVLGGNGFLGYYVTKKLAENGNKVICLENRLISEAEVVPNVEYIVGDAFNTETLSSVLPGVDSVYHFISTSLPNSGEKYLENEIRLSVQPLELLLNIMVEKGVKKIIFPSSGGAIYGNQSIKPVTEETLLEPTTTYGMGKQICEDIISYYCRSYQLSAYVFRVGNVYGSTRMRDKPQGVIDVFIQSILCGEPIKIWGNASKAVRDYIYLEDAAEAIVMCSSVNAAGFNVFNVGTGIGTSLEEIIHILQKIFNGHIDIEEYPGKKSGVNCIVLDSGKIRDFSGWKPTVLLREGIQRTIESKKELLKK